MGIKKPERMGTFWFDSRVTLQKSLLLTYSVSAITSRMSEMILLAR